MRKTRFIFNLVAGMSAGLFFSVLGGCQSAAPNASLTKAPSATRDVGRTSTSETSGDESNNASASGFKLCRFG
jgi:hypothetical protein